MLTGHLHLRILSTYYISSDISAPVHFNQWRLKDLPICETDSRITGPTRGYKTLHRPAASIIPGKTFAWIRLQIWEHLLVSTNAVTPRYSVCYDCGHKPDSERRAGQHKDDCIWDPQLSLHLYPQILRSCRLFYEEGIDLLYTKEQIYQHVRRRRRNSGLFLPGYWRRQRALHTKLYFTLDLGPNYAKSSARISKPCPALKASPSKDLTSRRSPNTT